MAVRCMLELWNALEKEFPFHYESDRTTRCMLLIAKLLFWWLYVGGALENHIGQQKRFAAFFGLEEEE